jgi:hypothetical protein
VPVLRQTGQAVETWLGSIQLHLNHVCSVVAGLRAAAEIKTRPPGD